jgi:hypothetical protein
MISILKVLTVSVWKLLMDEFNLHGGDSSIKFELLESSHWRSLEEKHKLKVLKLVQDGTLGTSQKAIEFSKVLPGEI